MSKLEQPVARMLDAYTAAVRARDVDGLVALYAQDMCVFDMWDRWAYEGVKAWRSMVEDWLGSLGVGRLRGFEAHPPEVTGRGSPPPLRELSDSCGRCSPRAAP